MPIFSRRVLQRLIDENHLVLERRHIEKHVKRLNEESDLHSLSHEWEIAILNALGKVGQLAHEKRISRRASTPDVHLTLPSGAEFVADITAISDVSLERLNPVDKFVKEIHQEFRRQGLPTARLSIRIEGRLEGKRPNQRMRLALPPDDLIPSVVQAGLSPLIETIRANPEEPATLVLADETVDAKLEYNPRGPAGLSHPSYTVPYSLTSNPLYNRLVDKATSLRKSGFQVTTGVILCDSDCGSLWEPLGYHQHFSRNQILTAFFAEYRFISFVWIVTAKEEFPIGSQPARRYIDDIVLPNPNADLSPSAEILAALKSAKAHLPPPARSAVNARHALRSWRRASGSFSHYGGGSSSDHEARLSARALLEFLAEKVDTMTFLRDHRMLGPPGSLNAFRRKLEQGMRLMGIDVLRDERFDDDWLAFTFSKQNDPQPICNVKPIGPPDRQRIETRVPSQALLGFLAGKMPPPLLLASYCSGSLGNPFRQRLEEGRLITSIDVEEDENGMGWLAFSFGDPDPAVSPFRSDPAPSATTAAHHQNDRLDD